MYQFFMNNWHILLTIYIVGAVLTFIGLIAFFYWIGKAEDEDRPVDVESRSRTEQDKTCIHAERFKGQMLRILYDRVRN